MSFNLKDLALWANGEWRGAASREVTGFCFDSRNINAGDCFVALRSATSDGHRFIDKAFDGGASAALATREYARTYGGDCPLLVVDDTLAAFHAIARGYRDAVNPFVVGVTGSVGKSTTKEWTAALLSEKYRTASTKANFNNDIGLPFSILSMAPDAEAGVFEAGMNHKGEMAPLCRTMRPDAGIVTAIAPVHLEFLGTLDAIADEKAELLRALPRDGFAVLDADGAFFDYLGAQTRARVVTVSAKGGDADFSAHCTDPRTCTFELRGRMVAKPIPVTLGIPGEHNIQNLLYAIAAARMRGVGIDAIQARVGNLPMMKMRWEEKDVDGVHWINDAYNANPTAMKAALKAFAESCRGRRRVCVLGEMRELGPDSEKYHREVGKAFVESNGDVLVAVGEGGCWIADGAVAAGFAGQVERFHDVLSARPFLADLLKPGDAVLLKASRGIGLERAMP